MATPTVPRSGSAIDGIQIDDARPLVTYDDDGAAILTVDVPTDVVNSVEERLKFETPGLYPIRTELLAGIGSGDILVATHGTVVQRLPGPNESAPSRSTCSIVTARETRGRRRHGRGGRVRRRRRRSRGRSLPR